jgi:RimJ/RimL family protein N-acetyltransferase
MENTQIITERLIIRPVSLEDAEDIYKYRSDKDINKYQRWIPESVNEVRDYIKYKISADINIPNTWFQMVILKKEDRELIGDIGIHFIDENGF